MNINIRNEESQDYTMTENIFREAFWNLYFPGCEEHFLAHEIRKHPDFIPELTFVIEIDQKIIGAIFYTHSKIVDQNNNVIPTITFGPVAILKEYQGLGLGRKLITYSIRKAESLGYKAIMICGYPYHYNPYGFTGTKKYSISASDGNFYTGMMALPLKEGSLDNIVGRLYFSTVFDDIDPEKVSEFDKSFPYKKKEHKNHHQTYLQALTEIDDSTIW